MRIAYSIYFSNLLTAVFRSELYLISRFLKLYGNCVLCDFSFLNLTIYIWT